jgi:hypothetical protein
MQTYISSCNPRTLNWVSRWSMLPTALWAFRQSWWHSNFKYAITWPLIAVMKPSVSGYNLPVLNDFVYSLISVHVIINVCMFYHKFSFPWYFYSWTSGAPHSLGFNFQIVPLSFLDAMSVLQLF